jgi:hypothetical protein
LIVGRRGGKSIVAALVAVFLAISREFDKHLSPGEVCTLMVIAADRRQARTVLRYINGFLDNVEILSEMIESRTKETITLTNRVCIEVHTASFRAISGYTIGSVVIDEVAYLRDETSANPAAEILTGLRPGTLTIPNSLILCIGSPNLVPVSSTRCTGSITAKRVLSWSGKLPLG